MPKSLLLDIRFEAKTGPLTAMDLDVTCPYTYCRICGKTFQTDLDRNPQKHVTPNYPLDQVKLDALLRRRSWSLSHARTHTATEHRQLQISGRQFTPEAQRALAPLGIISITDLVLSNEHEYAGLEAPRIPIADAEH
jgi:hypothetical protein